MAQYDLPYTGPQVEALLAKISELESEMPSKTSDLTNDSGFITSADVPTKTSDLNNDSGFITNAPVAAEAARAQAAEALLATIASLQAEIARATGVEGTLQDLIDGIAAKIPSAATDQNQLADKAFVNSSIATATAEFRGTYNSLAELQAVSADQNDYGYVRTTDDAGNTVFKRYKYASGSWVFEYDLNNSSFTASQWAAINSAITAELVEKLRALPTNAALTELLNGKQGVIADLDTIRANAAKGGTAYQKPAGGIPKSDMSPDVQSSLGKADSAVQDVSGKADKTELEALSEEVAKKANVEGYYGGMTVGSAENLVGRGSVEAEIQGIRTSAGQEDIGTGAAIIREVRGKSLVWNQLIVNGNFARGTYGWNTVGGSASAEGGILTYTKNNETINLPAARVDRRNVAFPAGHKYYYAFAIRPSVETVCQFGTNGNMSIKLSRLEANVWKKVSGIFTPSSEVTNLYYYCNREINLSPGDTVEYKEIILIDLTLMFGAGNEPTTVEEFERMFFLHFYEHNAGTIINNEATGLRTRGFNLYNPVTGKAVLPGKYSDYPYEYEICGAFTSISFEDYAGNVSTPELSNGRFFNVDAPGVLTVVGGNATDTCVHLVWSGWRNYGEPDYVYEPYWENTLPINIKTITGKLNGEGESVVIFPDGMRGVGPIYDRLIVDPDGFARRAVKVMESVDLGTLGNAWGIIDAGTTHERFQAFVTPRMKSISATVLGNILCSKYTTDTAGNIYSHVKDKTIGSLNGYVQVYDSLYSSQDTFIAAMSGVELVYELATPLEYVLDEPIPLTYMVDDFGTEAKLPVDTATLPTGPLRFAVTYPFNAVDKLRRQRKEMIPADNFDQFLVLLGQAYGGTWNRAYDATTDDQKFTYTPPESEPTGTTENNE